MKLVVVTPFRLAPSAPAALPSLAFIAFILAGCGGSKDREEAPAPPLPPVTNVSDHAAVPALADYEHVNPVAEKAWQTILETARPKRPPQEWYSRRASPEELAAWRLENTGNLIRAADLAKDFYTTYPRHPRARDARDKELEFLGQAAQSGATNVVARLEKLEQDRLADPNLTEDERYALKSRLVQQIAMSYESQGSARMLEHLERGVQELLKEFPGRPEPYELLAIVAANSPPEKSLALARQIAASDDASADAKERAAGLIKRLGVVGTPLALSFTDITGREINLDGLRGKVVLVEFWASWCAPCLQELPDVKAAYDQFHRDGFEIIGISLDQERAALDKVLQHYGVTWPQHFDGKGWGNEIAQRLGVTSIPAKWLVDKKGVVRDITARVDLKTKVQRLLAEE